MKTLLYSLVMVCFSLSFAQNAHTVEVFRCNGEEVRLKDTTYSVMKKCGQPAYQEVISAEGCEKVEKWHYDCKGRRFIDELTFKAGVLITHKQNENSNGTQNCP